MGTAIPMFPLGSVLLPGMPLPLHVFEPRYQALVHDCLAGTAEFGVVLIERGSEVGGGDVRTDVGTVARIVEAARFDDGRWAIGAVGVRRVRVERWLEDDPYPRAEVVDWPDDSRDEASEEGVREVAATLRRVLGLAGELGLPVAPATVELADDPSLALLQMCGVSPLGPADRQALLQAPGAASRLALLAEMLVEQGELLDARLAMGGTDDDWSG